MRLTRIRLKNWRNFCAIDVPLAQRAFLVGPNASGKSNFLDALRFLRDIADRSGGLVRAVKERGGMSAIRSRHTFVNRHDDEDIVRIGRSRTSPHEEGFALDELLLGVRVEVEAEIEGERWRYALEISDAELPRVEKEEVDGPHGPLVRRPDSNDKDDEDLLMQTHLEQVSTNKRFRKLTEMLASIEYSHIVPELVRDPRPRAQGRALHDPHGPDLISSIAILPERKRKRRLDELRQQLATAIPDLEEVHYEHDVTGPHIGLRFASTSNVIYLEDQLSDGTLRLLGLLWVLGSETSPLLLEEPELSLHSSAVRQIPQLLARSPRQTFVSTHSEDMLADTGIDPSEVLILTPKREGTQVTVGSEDPALVALAKADAPIAGMLAAKTRPADVERLASAFGYDK